MAALNRNRHPLPRDTVNPNTAPLVADKGLFVIYTADTVIHGASSRCYCSFYFTLVYGKNILVSILSTCNQFINSRQTLALFSKNLDPNVQLIAACRSNESDQFLDPILE